MRRRLQMHRIEDLKGFEREEGVLMLRVRDVGASNQPAKLLIYYY